MGGAVSERRMLLAVGNLTIDEVSVGGERRVQAGGASLYASAAAARLETDVCVVSKVGGDYPEEYLKDLVRAGINTRGVKRINGASSTRFQLDYRGEERRLYLRGQCRRIEPEDVADTNAEAVHIGPVFDEVPPRTVICLSAQHGLLSLDPQGYVRHVGKDGKVRPKSWFDARVLSRLHVFKCSAQELRLIIGHEDPWEGMLRVRHQGPEIVIATLGKQGALMMAGENRYHVPAFPITTADPTGAGDAFAGGFLS